MSDPRHIGVLGGMFDPVHFGHLQTAVAVRESLQLDQVRLLPCARPAHRDAAHASDVQRSAMLRLAISGHRDLCVDERELQRPGTSYLYDTMLSLRAELAPDHLYFVLGSDAFLGLERWHRWRELLDLCHWLVVPRMGAELSPQGALAEEFGDRLVSSRSTLRSREAGLIWVTEPSPLALSSTYIRSTLAQGRSLRFLTPDPVLDYIRQHNLYT